MKKTHFTAKEFLDHAEKNGLKLNAIIKEAPPKSGRKLLFGFEHVKRSRHYRNKFMLRNPIELSKLHEGPILKSVAQQPDQQPAAVDASAGGGATPPAIPGGQ